MRATTSGRMVAGLLLVYASSAVGQISAGCNCAWANFASCGAADRTPCYYQCCGSAGAGAAGAAGGGGVQTASCQCSWAQSGAGCDEDDGSLCWHECCIGSCQCGWAELAGGCDPAFNDGSPCWQSCCRTKQRAYLKINQEKAMLAQQAALGLGPGMGMLPGPGGVMPGGQFNQLAMAGLGAGLGAAMAGGDAPCECGWAKARGCIADDGSSCWYQCCGMGKSKTFPMPASQQPAAPRAPDTRHPIQFSGDHGRLVAEGRPFLIKGANWFGTESHNGAPGGLEHHDANWYFNLLSSYGFNALRLLFNHQGMLDNKVIDSPPMHGAALLQGVTYSEMFLRIAQVAADHNLLVMMAAHRLNPDAWPGEGLWYDSAISEAAVLNSWTRVAETLCNQWNVFAVDLMNEPHKASWGTGNPATDWNKAAERIGNHIQQQCPRLMIMVEGVGYDPGAPGSNQLQGWWWGENLWGVKNAPVRLNDNSKLVYSPHTYGPAVYMQDYFLQGSFPNNMQQIWDQHFGFVQGMTQVPVVIGEIGGDFQNKDRQWQEAVISYLSERQIGFFYFALNPDSKDTGGILMDDWTSPQTQKLFNLDRFKGSLVSDFTKRRELAAPA